MDELLGIRVPQSLQAEQAVLGSMLIEPDCIPDVLKDARAEHFYNKINRDIFETIYAMFNYGMTVDPITVVDQMKERGVFKEDSTEAYERFFAIETSSSFQEIIYHIDEALNSIKEGTYGICKNCGGLIQKPRLQALPFAKNCIRCQALHERRK